MIDFSKKPRIIGEKVILRPFQKGDLPYIEECINDPEVQKLTGSTSPINKEKLKEWYSTRNEQPDRLDLAIVDRSQGVLVGESVINLYDEGSHSMNFRTLIGPGGRDRGLGTEATGLIIDYVFQHTDLHELTLSVFEFNPRARKVYERLGFVEYSIDQDDLEFEGEGIDSINMKLTRQAWKDRNTENP
ncbi:GNAT family N-acetyltransferase [Halobacillus halophilus]|uniref:GNAT family N-acetyltransferase n=1 Tax=Halobacillus halophilus TaxID=1570 RepID=UPI001CD643E9|nr:GNAT family protein [Halobacillus halophilus]MCA1010535.1 GNAT family N-acetyltransferase [Halobacillus halophilus]